MSVYVIRYGDLALTKAQRKRVARRGDAIIRAATPKKHRHPKRPVVFQAARPASPVRHIDPATYLADQSASAAE